MHIVMTTDTLGGVWNYSINLLRQFQQKDVTVTLVTMGKALNEFQKSMLKPLNHVEVYETNYKLEWMDDPWRDLEASGDLITSLVDERKADLLHLNGFVHGALEVPIPKLVVGHSCVWSWWAAVKNNEVPTYFEQYFREVKNGFHKADWVVAPTATMVKAFNKIYGQRKNHSVVPNGIGLDNYIAGNKSDAIFCAGRVWDEAKNIQILNEIGADIDWPLIVAGNMEHPSKLASNTFTNLKMVGTLSENQMKRAYATSSIYIHPALYEPFGLAILEAAASGCALLLSDIPSLRENWNHAAVFVNPLDKNEIRQAVQWLVSDKERLAHYAHMAQKRASEFSIESSAATYLQLYQKLIYNHSLNFQQSSYEHKTVLS